MTDHSTSFPAPVPDGKWVVLRETSGSSALIRAASVPEGSVREAIAGDRVVALGCTGGHLFAIDGICLHAGGPLGEGRLSGETLTCPWHGWQYDVRTGRNCLNERIRTKSFPVRAEPDGTLSIQVD